MHLGESFLLSSFAKLCIIVSYDQWRPGVFRQGGGGPAAKWRPFKSNIVIKSLTRLAALAIFPTFVVVLFDTLTWSRAECRHLIDLGERGGLGVS